MSEEFDGLILAATPGRASCLESRTAGASPVRKHFCSSLPGFLTKNYNRLLDATTLGPVWDRNGGAPA